MVHTNTCEALHTTCACKLHTHLYDKAHVLFQFLLLSAILGCHSLNAFQEILISKLNRYHLILKNVTVCQKYLRGVHQPAASQLVGNASVEHSSYEIHGLSAGNLVDDNFKVSDKSTQVRVETEFWGETNFILVLENQ